MPSDNRASATTVHPAITLLLQEHESGRAQLARLTQAAVETVDEGSPAMLDVLDYLQSALELHIAREEGPLLPLLKAALPQGDRLIDEMVAEHDLIRIKRDELREVLEDLLGGHDDVRADLDALRDLATAKAPSASLAHAAADIAEKMRVHFENEEELVFPLAPQLLQTDQLDQAYSAMLALA
jgi:hemerythrin-like domain-containing protein